MSDDNLPPTWPELRGVGGHQHQVPSVKRRFESMVHEQTVIGAFESRAHVAIEDVCSVHSAYLARHNVACANLGLGEVPAAYRAPQIRSGDNLCFRNVRVKLGAVELHGGVLKGSLPGTCPLRCQWVLV
jgi:hypothetical protein